MPPDLNSLPPSRSPSGSPQHIRMPLTTSTVEALRNPSPSPSHSPPRSLAAAATLNAGIQNEGSRRSSGGSMRRDVERARRRSSIRMNLNLNDPTLPSPGELQISPSTRSRAPNWPASPHHERVPSLGDLHQELESEQEAQVNRLLNMIRQQQAQIAVLSTTHANNNSSSAVPSSSAVIDDSTPTSERSLSLPHSALASQQNVAQLPQPVPRSRSPFPGHGSLSRHSSLRDRSRGSSRGGSPALYPVSGALAGASEEWLLSAPAARDESAFYQAETQMLTRENQMLKLRIRELERQLAELSPVATLSHTPTTGSNLANSTTDLDTDMEG